MVELVTGGWYWLIVHARPPALARSYRRLTLHHQTRARAGFGSEALVGNDVIGDEA